MANIDMILKNLQEIKKQSSNNYEDFIIALVCNEKGIDETNIYEYIDQLEEIYEEYWNSNFPGPLNFLLQDNKIGPIYNVEQ